MIITQNIPINILKKYFIIEKSNKLLFIYFDYNKNEIKVNLINKSKIGYSILIDELIE